MTCKGDRHTSEFHDIKSHPEQWQAVVTGAKTFEVRLNDRDYQPEDFLILREYEPAPPAPKEDGDPSPAWGGKFTGRVALARITHTMDGQAVWDPNFIVPEGYVLLSIKLMGAVGAAPKQVQPTRRPKLVQPQGDF